MSKDLRCFIIDDEPPARAVLEKFISRISYLTLVGSSDNAIDALDSVQQLRPDLIFLDVEMPEMTGFEFIRVLAPAKPHIILVTAYPQYAVEGFNHEVTDYLLKPVSFERFMRAINKVVGVQPPADAAPAPDEPEASPPAAPSANTDFFLVKEDKKLIRIEPDEVIFVESMKDYLKIHLANRVIITHMTMNRIEELLPAASFIRINRSFIVRKGAIREIDGNQIITINKQKIPIGVTYRDAVLDVMKRNRI